MKDFLEKIYKELASIEDTKKRNQQRRKVEIMLERYSGEDRIVSMEEVVGEDKKLSPEGLREYSTGLDGLDKFIIGFRDSEVITIVGPTKNGKTTLAMTITANMIRAGHVPCWFSYEMTPLEFEEHMPGNYLPVIYTPRQLVRNNMKWVEERIVEAIAKYNSQIFFIDHLHYLCDLTGGGGENISIRIGRAMQDLKQIAKKWNICIVLLAHTVKIKATEDPTVASIRDSSLIAAESNTVLYVRRQGEEASYTNKTDVFVIAVRRKNTENGKTTLIYDHEAGELTQEYELEKHREV